MVPEMALALRELITFTLSNSCACWVQITDTPLTPEMTPALEALICSELHHPNILTTLRYACRPHKVCMQPSHISKLCCVIFMSYALLCYSAQISSTTGLKFASYNTKPYHATSHSVGHVLLYHILCDYMFRSP